MLRRHLLKFLAAVFCLSQLTLAVSAQTPTGSYSDVPIESPHYEAIEYLTDMGVTTGLEEAASHRIIPSALMSLLLC